jgi:ketosteroid isomerase-like protein
MRRILLIATLLSVAAPAVGRADDAEAAKELARLSQRIDEAYVKADTAFLDDLLANDWMHIGSDGRVKDKAVLLKALKERSTKYTAMDASEVKVRVYGDTAVVTGRYVAKYQDQRREMIDAGRFGRVFRREGARWQFVHGQSTLILAELPGASSGTP